MLFLTLQVVSIFYLLLFKHYKFMSDYLYFPNNLKDITHQTFPRCFNVALRLIWRRDVRQSQTNVEVTFCTTTLEFSTLNNVESTLSISTLIWHNVKLTLPFSTSICKTLSHVETTLWMWPLKKWKINFESRTC